MNSNKKWDTLITCLLVSYVIISLRYFKNYPIQIINLIQSLLGMAEAAIVAFGLSPIAELLATIPIPLILIVTSIIAILIDSVFVVTSSNTIINTTEMLSKNFFQILLSGLLLYFMFASVIFMFAFSVFGIPIAAVILIILELLVIIAGIPLSVYIGRTIQQILNINILSTYSYFLLGSFMMFLSKTVYSFGGAFLFFVYPVITFGIAFMYIVNIKIKKINYCSNSTNKNKKENFDRNKIRDIIKKDI